MKTHIFVDAIINKFENKSSQYYSNKKIKNGENTLLMTPITEVAHYLQTRFKNHTLLGSSDSRNFYAFDTNEGILLLYPAIPFSTKPALGTCLVTYYENKKELVNAFLPKKEDSIYNYEYHQKKYAKILKNIDKVSPTNDDSNNIKNVIGRIESIRKSSAPLFFEIDKPKPK